MKKEYDLKKLQKRPGRPKVDPEAVRVQVNLRLDAADVAELRAEAERQGLPYQTLIGSVLHRYVAGDLIDRKAVQLVRDALRDD
jgi:predicted DNA binding CopG/RHH family protein